PQDSPRLWNIIILVDMNKDSRGNGIISNASSSNEQEPHVKNGQNFKHLLQKQPDSPNIVALTNNKINKAKSTYTTFDEPCWSRHESTIAAGSFGIFITIAVIISTLMICFHSPKASVKECQFKFAATRKNPIDYNRGPRSVAIGYFNNDTWLDFVIVDSIVNTISIFIGHSDGTFSYLIEYTTGDGSTPNMVVVVDFNNDNVSDIAVANFGVNNIGIFFGWGNGTFDKQITTSTGSSHPKSIYFADLNNDTLLDIVIVNYGTHSVTVMYGDGYGKFLNPTNYSTGYDSFPSSLVIADLNNDNNIDLTVANCGTHNVLIWYGSKNGTFSNQKIISTGIHSCPQSIVVGYFNNDTLLDIAVALYGMKQIGIFINKGNGTFTNKVPYSTDNNAPYTIDVADFNQDNRIDLVITNNGSKNMGVFLGYGDGTFEKNPLMYSTGATSTISHTLGDFNKDRQIDIILLNNDTRSVDILLGSFEGFETFASRKIDFSPYSAAVGDFNNDKQLDVVVTSSNLNYVNVLLGYGNGSFSNQTKYSVDSSSDSVAVGDFNNDNQLDIVVANRGTSD
ncbi:unnamed protein product, partial [Rotaria sp. Silwood2]